MIGQLEIERKFQVALFFKVGSREVTPGKTIPLSGNRTLYVDGDTAYVLTSKPNEVGKRLSVDETVAGPWMIPFLRPIYRFRKT